MGMRTWLTNLTEAGQVRLLNVQLDKLFRSLKGVAKNEKEEGELVTFPLSIKNGGTSASDVEGAREALGAAAKDHEHTYKHPVVFESGVETLTGDTWIDGKPIYRYVCTATTTAVGGVTIGNLPEVPDTIISLTGVFKRSTDNAWISVHNAYYTNLGWSVNIMTNGGTALNVTFGGSNTGMKTVIVIAEYTKPTD